MSRISKDERLLQLQREAAGDHLYANRVRVYPKTVHGLVRRIKWAILVTCLAIYYLLPQGEISAWHRVDAAEIWHWYGGAALKLRISADGETVAVHRLGNRLRDGERPQVVVPPYAWQSAESLGSWTLVGCTVSPAFEFRHFELAPHGWEPVKR